MSDQLRRDWVARFTTLLPENRARAKSGVSSVTSSSLPMGWALQKPRAGGTRYLSQVQEYLMPEKSRDAKPILNKLPST